MQSESKILEVHVPKIEHEGEEAPATVLRFKRTDNLAERVSIEIDPGSLNYIRLATLQRGSQARTTPLSQPRRPEKKLLPRAQLFGHGPALHQFATNGL